MHVILYTFILLNGDSRMGLRVLRSGSTEGWVFKIFYINRGKAQVYLQALEGLGLLSVKSSYMDRRHYYYIRC